MAISLTVNSEGLIGKAKNAVGEWNNRTKEEQNSIENLLGYLGVESGGTPNLPAGWDEKKIPSVFTEISTIYEEEPTIYEEEPTVFEEEKIQKERKVPIPAGYSVSGIEGEDSISSGLVIYEGEEAVEGEKNSPEHVNAMETRNQYVWIPVDNINSMVMCKRNGQSTKLDGEPTAEGKNVCELVLQGNELVCETHGYTTATPVEEIDDLDTTGLAGRLYGKGGQYMSGNIYQTNMTFTDRAQTFSANSSYREPDIVSNYDETNSFLAIAGMTNGTDAKFKKQLNEDFINMAKSVAKYGGFYVSRYEAGVGGASKKNQLVLSSATSASGNYLAGNMWYGLYNTLRNGTSVVNSHMVWRKPVRPNYKIYRNTSTSWTRLSNY